MKLLLKALGLYEAVVYKIHSLNTNMEIEKVDFTYMESVVGSSLQGFRNTHSYAVIYEPLYYQVALDKFIYRVFSAQEKEVVVDLHCYRGLYFKVKVTKSRKTINRQDYIKMAYYLRFLTRLAYPEVRYKKLIKQACKLACKERKRFEKNGGICI